MSPLHTPSYARAGVVAAPQVQARLPPLPTRGERHDGLAPSSRRAMVGVIVAVHVAAGWGLLQIREVRDAVAEVAPIFVSLVAPDRPPEPAPPPPRPQPPAVVKSVPRPLVTAPPRPEPAVFEAPAPVPVAEPLPIPAPPIAALPEPVAVAPAPPPPAPPPPAPPPKVLPASAVQYLEPISLEYPRVSKRLRETGRVLIRVFIDEAGVAKNVRVERSSGHPRLDEAALAAVQKARFRPYTENGQAVAGTAFIPLDFELEK